MLINDELELIIFDLDGTLINTDTIYTLGWKTILKEYAVSLPEKVLAEMNGQSTEQNNDIVNSYLKDPAKTREARRKREEFVIDALETGVLTFKPGAKEILDELKGSKYRLALATSSPSIRGERIVEKLDLADYFEVIIYGDGVEEKKPSPEIYVKVLEALQCQPENAIAIEDSRSGVVAALNADVAVILVSDRDTSEFEGNDNTTIFKSLHEVAHTYFKL